MAANFFNMVLEPFYTAFETFAPNENLMQFTLLTFVVIGSIKLAINFLKY